ncbi:hypothetical protein GCM10011382_05080 [Vreelandella lutescens]|uniref:Uncharacterized protein n=1 Tax=Vreelandella lutescens TaxID=1602943 RepID=A0ABQ1NR84_9GAMM|nr:hypothetical protein GCM10011382_05080 [Halomonas lutescens]
MPLVGYTADVLFNASGGMNASSPNHGLCVKPAAGNAFVVALRHAGVATHCLGSLDHCPSHAAVASWQVAALEWGKCCQRGGADNGGKLR